MDTELDSDIESLKTLINDELSNSNNDDECSQNSFDVELNLLATTLNENDAQTELKHNAQSNTKSKIEPNNHISDKKLKPTQKFHGSSDKYFSKIVIMDENECMNKKYCDTENNCDSSEAHLEFQTSVAGEGLDNLKCKYNHEKCCESIVASQSLCSVSMKVVAEERNESICGIRNSENQKEVKEMESAACAKEEVNEELLKENSIDTDIPKKSNVSCMDENETSIIYCSTPRVNEIAVKEVTASLNVATEFGLLSPLTTDTSAQYSSHNMKRKLCCDTLPAIREEEEEELLAPMKKTKFDSRIVKNLQSHMKTIDPPAVVILKKWRPKCLSSSSSFYVIDEVGDAQSSQSEKEDDDFEIAMKSLSEELVRQSNADDLKTLDLYHSHVLAENEEDGVKFEEILQQMTNELEGMSEFISVDKKDDSIYSSDDTGKNEVTVLEFDIEKKDLSSTVISDSQKNHESTLVEKQLTDGTLKNLEPILDKQPADYSEKSEGKIISPDDPVNEDITIIKENVRPVENGSEESPVNENTEYITLTADEEDILLEDEPEVADKSDTNQNKKPREMVEFISKDPKENEDNFNPEWELLRKLSTDEERYKAVRQRWRSLVIPDPKRDLTFRQWRQRNNLPPSKHLQDNATATKQQIRKYVGNQLCTALFDQNIEGIVRQQEEKRLALHKELQSKIVKLGHIQNQEQQKLYNRGASYLEISRLYLHHMEELRHLQSEYQRRLQNEETTNFEKVAALKKASAEVLAFEKFYQGLDNDKKDNAVFLSDIEIQELMETDIMLEQYDRYYK